MSCPNENVTTCCGNSGRGTGNGYLVIIILYILLAIIIGGALFY